VTAAATMLMPVIGSVADEEVVDSTVGVAVAGVVFEPVAAPEPEPEPELDGLVLELWEPPPDDPVVWEPVVWVEANTTIVPCMNGCTEQK
jgi:hypothetical protein